MLDDGIGALIGRIYTQAHDDDGLAGIAHDLLARTGSATALIAAADPARRSLGTTRWYGAMATRQARALEMLDEVGRFDPTLAHFARRPAARHFDTALDRDADTHRDDAYVRWHRDHFGGTHWTVCHTGLADGSTLGIALHLREPGVAHRDDERRLFRMLFDHLVAAAQQPDRLVLPDAGEPMLALGSGGRIDAASAAAAALVAAGDGVVVEDGRIAAEGRHQRRAFAALIDDALRALDDGGTGGGMALERGSGRPPLLATVSPLPVRGGLGRFRPGALLRLIDRTQAMPPLAGERWRQLWGLTPAEARLAVALVETDCDLRAAAARLGVAYATVRTQLAAVLAKSQCRGQAELMRLLTRVGG